MHAFARTITRLFALAAVAATVTSVAACGSDSKSSTGPKGGDLGKYTLSRAGDHSLPATVFNETVNNGEQVFQLKIVVKSGYIELKSGGACTASMALDIYLDDQIQDVHGGTFQCTWEKDSNNDIQFSSDEADGIGDFFGNLSNGQITTQLDLSGTSTPASFTFKK